MNTHYEAKPQTEALIPLSGPILFFLGIAATVTILLVALRKR